MLKAIRFVTKTSQLQPRFHSKARVLSTQLENGPLLLKHKEEDVKGKQTKFNLKRLTQDTREKKVKKIGPIFSSCNPFLS